MLGIVLIIVGTVLMLAGSVMLAGWAGGKSNWFGPGVYDRAGNTKADRQALYLYFVALIIAPLLGGAIMIAFGLQHLC